MIAWCLLPPLAFIGRTLRETGEEITNYAMSLDCWINFIFVKAFMSFCTIIILYQIYVIAFRIRNA